MPTINAEKPICCAYQITTNQTLYKRGLNTDKKILENRLPRLNEYPDKKRRLTNMLCSTKEQRIKAYINEV